MSLYYNFFPFFFFGISTYLKIFRSLVTGHVNIPIEHVNTKAAVERWYVINYVINYLGKHG